MSGAVPQSLRFGRFALVGLVGAALQLALVALLTVAFQWPAAAAALIAVEAAVLHNFIWHERYTWRDRESAGRRQRVIRLWRFHAGNGLISLVGNSAVTYVLVEWLHVPVLPAALAALALCTPANYLLADRWAYAVIPCTPG